MLEKSWFSFSNRFRHNFTIEKTNISEKLNQKVRLYRELLDNFFGFWDGIPYDMIKEIYKNKMRLIKNNNLLQNGWVEWIYMAPGLICILANFIFFINIFRILVSSLIMVFLIDIFNAKTKFPGHQTTSSSCKWTGSL